MPPSKRRSEFQSSRDPEMQTEKAQPILNVRNLNIWYGEKPILRDLSFEVQQRQVTAFIGPTNSGKKHVGPMYQSLKRLYATLQVHW